MVVVMIVVMVMMIVIMVVMIMIMVIMIMVIVFVVVMMHVGRHDTCQADRVMWMIGAVTAAMYCAEAGAEKTATAPRPAIAAAAKTKVLLDMDVPLQKQCRNVLGQALFPAI